MIAVPGTVHFASAVDSIVYSIALASAKILAEHNIRFIGYGGWIWRTDTLTNRMVNDIMFLVGVAAAVIVVGIWLLVRSFVLFNGVSSVVAIIINLGE